MKKKIVIASVLKPVDDVRSYWKLSQSILKTNKYEVNIIGNVRKKAFKDDKITFYQHKLNRKNWIQRFIVREQILFKILKIRPHILIISTHELLNVALIIKLITGCKVVYDVQEDHYKNLRFIQPSPLRSIYGLIVRLQEQISRLFVNSYWLAEECYEEEIGFTQGKSVTIENKAFDYSTPARSLNEIRLLFSGTVSDYSGVKNAIRFFEELKEKHPDTRLKIIGQIHDNGLESWLLEKQKEHEEIDLQISHSAIPHPEILDAISSYNLGVIGYEPNKINRRKIPTKLYEYSRYQLPYVIAQDSYWAKVGDSLGGSIPVDFENIDIEKVIEKWKNSSVLFPLEYPTEATWEFESGKLIQSMKNLSNKS